MSQYCIPSYSTGCAYGDGLTLFNLGAINQTITCSSAYHDYTTSSTIINAGQTSTLTVQAGHTSTCVYVWIDFNNSSSFEPTELVASCICTASSTNTTSNIIIPNGTPVGNYRLRFKTDWMAYPIDACSAQTYGNSADFTITINPNLPNAAGTITGNTNVCQGQNSVIYTVPLINFATSYIWTLPNGTKDTTITNSITVNYGLTDTSGSISVNGANLYENGIASTLAINVNQIAEISSQSTETQTQCLNGSFMPITVTPTGIGTGLTFQWFSNTLADTTGMTSLGSVNGAQTNSYTPQATLAGTLYYYCIVSGICGTPKISTVSGAFITNPLPVPTISGPTTVCANSTENIYTTQAGMTAYSWVLNGGIITAGAGTDTVTVTWISSGTNPIIVNYTNNIGCNSSSYLTYPVIVNSIPAPKIVIPITSLLSESFENGGATPTEWATQVISGANTISFVTSTTWPIGYTAYNGTYLVMFNSFTESGGVNRLKRTIPISTIGLTSANVNFAWLESSGYAGVLDRVDVEYSTDGLSWITAGVFNRYNSVQGWKIKSQALPAGALGQATLYIAFKFSSAYGNDCYLDFAGVSTPETFCEGSTGSYTTESGMNAYIWSTSPGGIITSGDSTNAVNVQWNTAGTQTLSVSYANSYGCSATNVISNVAVNPKYNIVSNKTICKGDSVVVGTHVYTTSGVYTDQFATILGCDSIITITLIVDSLPTTPGIISGLTTVCQGQNAVVYALPQIANATSYLWTLPDGADGTSDSNSIAVNFNNSALSGNIIVKGVNFCGLSDSVLLPITVKPLPLNDGTITGDTVVCQEQNLVSYAVTSITNATSYIWSLPTGATGTSTTNNITVNYGPSSISGNITVKGNNNCGNGQSDILPIIVKPKPSAPTIILNGNVLLSNIINGNNWYNQNGILNGAINQYYVIQSNGNYYDIISLNGCSSDTSNIIHFDNTGIVDNEIINILKVYPNPTKDNLTIETNFNTEQKLEILNLIGQTIYSSIINKKAKINTSAFAKGVYIIKLISDNETVVKRFVKE